MAFTGYTSLEFEPVQFLAQWAGPQPDRTGPVLDLFLDWSQFVRASFTRQYVLSK